MYKNNCNCIIDIACLAANGGITKNEWKQFETMINFTAIPRGALVSKEGKLIEQDFEISQFNSEELKKLAERF